MREVFGLGGGGGRIAMPEMRMSATPGYLELGQEQMQRLICHKPIEEYYEVEDQPFARGKYAAVRRCRHRTSGQQFAAKFLRKRRRSADLRPEILHEVAVLEACAGSPRIVRLHQVFESAHEMILLLELASGGELQMLLDRDEVPEECQVKRLMRQILDGLVYLHSINVAHLDIKPQNLVLTSDYPHGEVKLCDLGISRHVGQGADIRDILGTPDYVAPEVLSFEPISLATDMWSVGVLLYVLLTGCSPFGGDTKQETFCNISQCRLDFPEDLFEDISEDAKDLMCKLMVKEPSKRLTAAQCLQHKWFTNCSPEMPLSTAGSVAISEPTISTKKVVPSASKEITPVVASSSAVTPPRKFSAPSSPIAKLRTSETSNTSVVSKTISKTVSTIASNTVTVCRSREVTKVVAETAKPVVSSSAEDNRKTGSVTAEKNRLGGMSSFRRKNFMKNMESLAQSYADLSIAVEEENNNAVMVENHNQTTSKEPANDNDVNDSKVVELDNNNRLPATSSPSQLSTNIKNSSAEVKESKVDNSLYLLSTRNKAIAVQTMPIRSVIERYNRLESNEPLNSNSREHQNFKNVNVSSTEQKGCKSTMVTTTSSVQRRTLENRDCVYTFRKCYIIDDSDDEVAQAAATPMPHHTTPHLLIHHHHQNSGGNGHHISYSDHSSSDSGSDTVSEMSIDSSSDRSSIISLDDSLLEYSYSKISGGRLYPNNSSGYISCSSSSSSISGHHNVWDTMTTGRNMSSRPRYSYNESFSRAFARFNSVPGENGIASTRDAEHRKHEDIGQMFTSAKKHFAKAAHTSSTVLSSSKLATAPTIMNTDSSTAGKKTVDFLRSGNLVVIREVKPIGRYSRVCEVKCESIQSRIRKLQVHQGSNCKS